MPYLFSPKFIVLYIYILAVSYTQFRGKVRLKFSRQLINHSTFIAPLNALMYLFSGVPNQPFYDVKQFPDLEILQKNWEIIRDEAKNLVNLGYIKAADQHNDLGFNSFFKRGWKRFYLKWYQHFLPSAESFCPKTVALLQTIPTIHGAMFTLLPANGQLKPHRDPYAGSLRYHLGLITPNSNECAITVDGITYFWKNGEGVLFDETYIHAAKNTTSMDRIILFCDVERPLTNKIVTAINRFFCRYIMAESATQNFTTDRIGIFNKIYKYYNYFAYHAIRLKKRNKKIYHFLQYTSIAGLAYFIFF